MPNDADDDSALQRGIVRNERCSHVAVDVPF